MPIKINRNTGDVLSAPELTPEQNQRAWEIIVNTYVEKHLEKLMEDSDEENDKGPE